MAVTYDEIAYDEIELGLRSIISKEFANVYIANEFTMKGNECVRINLDSSSLLLQSGSLEQREYLVTIRYYNNYYVTTNSKTNTYFNIKYVVKSTLMILT